MPTISDHVRARAGDERTALLFEDERWTWDEVVQASADRASLLAEVLADDGAGGAGAPPHVGLLLENVPEYALWLQATALVGATIVGINPTRRGAELARDITHTDCRLVVTSRDHRVLLDGIDLGLPVWEVDSDAYRARLETHRGTPLPSVDVAEDDLYLLLFTSGSTGAPKAVRCSQGRLAGIAEGVTALMPLGPDDVCYAAMPLFHSNALMAGWAPALAAGATTALRRRFSASGFLPDVRRFGVTYINYVGKPLSYVLATPEKPDDADNPLRIVFGNEAAELDIERFAHRFGCRVIDAYGSTEGGAIVTRTPDMPPGALGQAGEGTVVLDPDTAEECPPARFDERGTLLNADEAIGELVNKQGAAGFEGYWRNEEAQAARTRGGWYWTGDLAYRDEAGFFYFAGRAHDWLRVDGENFAAAPVERILLRHPDVVMAVVYAVPDVKPDGEAGVGDQLMAALELRPRAVFDPSGFDAFLSEQTDLGTKWAPRFVRVIERLPLTESQKVRVQELRRERWEVDDPVWWRREKGGDYARLSPDEAAGLSAACGQSARM